MADRAGPQVYSIAAHRGFADALVAGLIPRYAEPEFGLARLTLLLPSARAARTLQEAFVRSSGGGLLMPRMVVVGDLDLDEALGALLDPLGAADIPPAVEPIRRWLRLAALIPQAMRALGGREPPRGAALLKLAQQFARTMDRLLVEDVAPDELWQPRVIDAMLDQSAHWIEASKLFAAVQALWRAELEASGTIDAAGRRNRLFEYAGRRWQASPPPTPIVAAGVTSAAPALARLLRIVSELPRGAVIVPDLDLAMPDHVWDELGAAGARDNPDDPPFAPSDAVTHPQYHLKLLLNRMGVGRAEVQPWHRRGAAAAAPERSHAISALFLPPQASRAWVDLPPEKRRLAGVRVMESATVEAEAQAIALLIREAVAVPEKRVALVTPDRGLARRVVEHLARWNLTADDSAGRPLSDMTAGRLLLQLAEVAAQKAAPVPLIAALGNPLVRIGEGRGTWLENLRAFDRKLRGPRPAPGLAALRPIAAQARVSDWWREVEAILEPLLDEEMLLADWLDRLAQAGEALAGAALWSREDGRALAAFVEDLRLHAREVGTTAEAAELPATLRDAMEGIAVRPPFGGHPRVAIYGLIESRMARADLVIAAGLNEGTWPTRPATDPLLAPAVLRALGVPGADFRIGLNAHDLASALGAPEVVLSRSRRDASGPAIASRFLLRVQALLGELGDTHREAAAPALAGAIDEAPPAARYRQPAPLPSAAQRKVEISVTGLDRLRADPYQFYASNILRLPEIDPLDAEPSPAWQGTLAHKILEVWHDTGRPLAEIAGEQLAEMNPHPLTRALWRPRLLKALEWVAAQIAAEPGRVTILFEKDGTLDWRGVTLKGRIDRLDRLADGTLAVVDYKTGRPPSGARVQQGYAMQLGTLGLMVEGGAFADVQGSAGRFEYWSLAKNKDGGFGYVETPILEGRKIKGIPAGDFLPEARRYLDDALDRWILGSEPFTARLNPDAPGYETYDQLMRLDEWVRLQDEAE